MPSSTQFVPTATAPVRQHYSPEAVEAILSHALELQSVETCSPEQLQAMATELNIAPETLKAAEQQWQSRQAEILRKQAKLEKQRQYRRQQWLQYGAGSLLMVGIDIATAGTITWSVFPVLGWGLSVVLGGCNHASSGDQASLKPSDRDFD
ncbi:MAG: 2TM domain-containing protein [Leptolyngbyaceae cyanobacterium]